jgi:hypothetical protein
LNIGSGSGGRIQNKAGKLGVHLIFLDESRYLVAPNVARTEPPGENTCFLSPLQKGQNLGDQFSCGAAQEETSGPLTQDLGVRSDG